MSDSDSEADTEDYEPPQHAWRWLEADEFMETEFMEDEPTEFMQNEADEFQQAGMRPTVMEDKDRIREQRMIMVFTCVITWRMIMPLYWAFYRPSPALVTLTSEAYYPAFLLL